MARCVDGRDHPIHARRLAREAGRLPRLRERTRCEGGACSGVRGSDKGGSGRDSTCRLAWGAEG
eukprot:4544893-Alexandrium_andersonii.AAC.1